MNIPDDTWLANPVSGFAIGYGWTEETHPKQEIWTNWWFSHEYIIIIHEYFFLFPRMRVNIMNKKKSSRKLKAKKKKHKIKSEVYIYIPHVFLSESSNVQLATAWRSTILARSGGAFGDAWSKVGGIGGKFS